MAGPLRKLTVDEYLAFNEAAEVKHEFVNGELVAMSGGTARHAAVAMELGARLYALLVPRGHGCRPTGSDQRLYVEETDAWYYPDLQVICGRWAMASDGVSVTNPTVIVEVLSPSTRSRDLGEKWAHYRRIPSLQTYLIVDHAAREVLAYRRAETGWTFTEHTSGSVALAGIDVELAIADIFRGLDDLPPDP